MRFQFVQSSMVIACFSCLWGSPLTAQPMGPPPPVFVAPVIEREIVGGQTFVGTVKPIKTSVIGSAVDGRVEEFYVDDGMFVPKGKPIAKLRTGTLEIERDAAAAELRVREAEEAEMTNGSRPEEIEAARASLAAAEARRTYTRARRDRYQELFKRGSNVSQDEVQEAVANHDQAEQVYLQMKANYDLVKAGPRQEKKDQARAKVLHQVEIVRKLDDQIKLHTVRAYFDGFVTVEHCELGQWLLKGQAVVEMVKLDEVEVEVGVSEEVVFNLKEGTSARIDVVGLPKPIEGKVTSIVPQANQRTRTFPVKVLVKDNLIDGRPVLKSNLVAKVTLQVGAKEKAFLVPKDAVVLGGPSPIVFVTDATEKGQATVRPIPVQLGVADGSWIQVKGDVRLGMKVVVNGNERIRPGQTVTVAKEIDVK